MEGAEPLRARGRRELHELRRWRADLLRRAGTRARRRRRALLTLISVRQSRRLEKTSVTTSTWPETLDEPQAPRRREPRSSSGSTTRTSATTAQTESARRPAKKSAVSGASATAATALIVGSHVHGHRDRRGVRNWGARRSARSPRALPGGEELFHSRRPGFAGRSRRLCTGFASRGERRATARRSGRSAYFHARIRRQFDGRSSLTSAGIDHSRARSAWERAKLRRQPTRSASDGDGLERRAVEIPSGDGSSRAT